MASNPSTVNSSWIWRETPPQLVEDVVAAAAGVRAGVGAKEKKVRPRVRLRQATTRERSRRRIRKLIGKALRWKVSRWAKNLKNLAQRKPRRHRKRRRRPGRKPRRKTCRLQKLTLIWGNKIQRQWKTCSPTTADPAAAAASQHLTILPKGVQPKQRHAPKSAAAKSKAAGPAAMSKNANRSNNLEGGDGNEAQPKKKPRRSPRAKSAARAPAHRPSFHNEEQINDIIAFAKKHEDLDPADTTNTRGIIKGDLYKAQHTTYNLYWSRAACGLRLTKEQRDFGHMMFHGDMRWTHCMTVAAKACEHLASWLQVQSLPA